MQPHVLSDGQHPPLSHIIHIADIHVRVGNHDTARVEEYQHVFDAFCEELAQIPSVCHGTALLVIAGDVFHNKGRMDSVAGRMFFLWINRLLEMLPILVICGNHDFRQEDPAFTDMIDLFSSPYAGKQLHYIRDTGLYTWENVGFGVTSIKDTLRAFNTAGIKDDLDAFPDPTQLPATVDCRVALFHGTIVQSTLPSGRFANSMATGYSLDWFQGYDIAMLGDNHKQQIHCYESMAWGYPGSLVQQDFGEPTFGHGYILWDVSARTGSMHHIPNQFGAFTIGKVDGVYTAFFAPKMSAPLVDALSQPRTPKSPRIRVVGNASDVASVRELLTPHSIKFVGETEPQRPQLERDTHTTTLADLNRPDQWEAFIKAADPTFDGHDLIHAPASMLLPLVENVPQEIVKNMHARNAKLQQLLDAYDAASQRVAPRQRAVSLVYMEWEYLMCYERNNHFRFEDLNGQVALLNGNNAIGKSAFMDIVSIALFGEPTSSRRDFTGDSMTAKIIYDHKPDGESSYVLLQLNTGETAYEIHRTFSYASDGKRQEIVQQKVCVIYEIKDGQRYVIAEGTTRVSQWIQRTVGTLEELQMSSMLCQHDNSNFFFQKPGDQRLILERALNMDTITAFEQVSAEAVKAHKYVLGEVLNYHAGLVATAAAPCLDDPPPPLSELAALDASLKQLTSESHTLLAKIGTPLPLDDPNVTPEGLQLLLSESTHHPFDALLVVQGELQQRQKAIQETMDRLGMSSVSPPPSAPLEDEPEPPTMSREHIATRVAEYDRWRVDADADVGTSDPQTELIVARQRMNALQACQISHPEIVTPCESLLTKGLDELEITLQTARSELFDHLKNGPPPHGRSVAQCQTLLMPHRPLPTDEFEGEFFQPKNTSLTTDTVPLFRPALRRLRELELEMQGVSTRPAHDAVARQAWLARWHEWETFASTVSNDSLRDLQTRHAILTKRAELRELKRIEFNPECNACCKQPKWIRLQTLKQVLKPLKSKVTCRSIPEIEQQIRLRAEYEREFEHMSNEREAWSCAMEEHARTEEYDMLACKIWNTVVRRDAAADLLRAQAFEAWNARLIVLQHNVHQTHSALWSVWNHQHAAAHHRVVELEAIIEHNKTANEAARLWNIELAQLKSASHALTTWEEWAKRKLAHDVAAWNRDRDALNANQKIAQYSRILAFRDWTRVQSQIGSVQDEIDCIRTRITRFETMRDACTNKSDHLADVVATLAELQTRHDRVKALHTRFAGEKQDDGFKTHIYKACVLPLIEKEVNEFLAMVDTFRLRIRIKGAKLIFMLEDRGNLPTLDHASGYQRFVVTLGMRIALSRIGAVGQSLMHLFLDEGFTACDGANLQKTSEMLQDILLRGGYRCILLMSHLDTIRDAARFSIPIERNEGDRSSRLRFGLRRIPLPKGVRSGGEVVAAKTRGRPRKT